MTSQKRQLGDIIHLIEPHPEKKHVVLGVVISLLLHGLGAGKIVYDSWKQVKQWGGLLSIEVIDQPGAVSGRPRVDLITLTQPLYYPPGLVKPKSHPASQEAERRRRQQRRQQAAQRALEQQQAQAQQPTASETGPQDQQAELQSKIQLLQQGIQRARTLNIGPIREQIENLYRAQQEGKISIGRISVAVNFRVREDGAFTHVHLVESSGIPEVDNAALIIVDELGQLRSLAPLQKTESVTLRLTIDQEVELQTTVASPSEAVAAEQVQQLNGLLMAARLWTTTQKQTRVAQFLSTIEIKRVGVNIVASARIPRGEASRLLKKQFGSGG